MAKRKIPKAKDSLLFKTMANKLLASQMLLQHRTLQPSNDNGDTANCENAINLLLFNSLLIYISLLNTSSVKKH